MLAFLASVALGLIVLVRSADQFVLGAARIAAALRVSAVVIGALVIGFGTSVPEMFVSGLASAHGDTDLGVGNVVGSNIANLSLVLGVAALLVPVDISSVTLRREAPLMAASCLLFGALVWDGLNRFEGLALVAVLAVMLSYIVVDALRGADAELVEEVAEFVEGAVHSTRLESLRTGLGLVGTLVGAQLLVHGAVGLATEVGLAQGFIGLTLVAVGTSLPELTTAVAAARREEDELIVGNLLGSNIFNSLAVGGAIAFAGPGEISDPGVMRASVVIMLAVVAGAWLFMGSDRKVQRWEAALLLGGYVLCVPLLAGQ